jgi:hypothetical protein
MFRFDAMSASLEMTNFKVSSLHRQLDAGIALSQTS